MIRRIIVIDESRCTGCGLCAQACHEGAIGMVAGKAKLLREDYCDGLGDCLPACPADAISFEEREAPAYNEAAVLAAKALKAVKGLVGSAPKAHTCPGTACKTMSREASASPQAQPSMLQNFPVQLKLVPYNAPFFDGADLLLAADCSAFACGDFHRRFMQDKITLIGCPKLDSVDYAQKLTQIFTTQNIRSISLVRMQVPCCGGLTKAVETAIRNSGKEIPLSVTILSSHGTVIEKGV